MRAQIKQEGEMILRSARSGADADTKLRRMIRRVMGNKFRGGTPIFMTWDRDPNLRRAEISPFGLRQISLNPGVQHTP
jgi:hypothetical protein